jgi:uncharacterized membrane protein
VLAYSTGVFNTLKFVHIVAAIIWVGAGLFFQFQSTRMRRANDPTNLARFAADVGYWGLHLLMPASLTVLVMGVVMVLYSPALGFSQTWIWLGLVGYGITFLTGALFLGPTAGRLSQMAQTRSPDDPEVQAGIRRIFAISRVDQMVILLVVADMVFKPGL